MWALSASLKGQGGIQQGGFGASILIQMSRIQLKTLLVSVLAGPFHSLSLGSCLGLSAPIEDVDLGSKVVQSQGCLLSSLLI